MPVGSELNEGLGRTSGQACEHAAALGFEMGGNTGGTARGEGSDWALPIRGEGVMGDATGVEESDVREFRMNRKDSSEKEKQASGWKRQRHDRFS